MSGFTLYYWTACTKFWGRGTGAVLALEHAGKVKDKDYFIKDRDEVVDSTHGFAVPMVTFPNGATVAQAPAIMMILGEELGLDGKTSAEKMKTKQNILDVEDVFAEASGGKWEKPERKEKWMKYLESKLEGKKFFGGEEPSVVDFHSIFAFCWLEAKGFTFAEAPKLTQWWADVKQVPAVHKMLNSGVSVLP
eukprot:TRINITY_DN9800_c0_g1_i1.p1 TRINITY_DN9800_c0_g1~~TRINITY_DN9800_c0_g1_i1.p1  ORF type:complete len:211 (+),score=73.12 TRINITY_DN9800_c0_g1_i1:58-633(+)